MNKYFAELLAKVGAWLVNKGRLVDQASGARTV